MPVTPPHRIDLPGRLTLDVVDTGDREGTPILLLHGITDSWRSFELLLPELPGTVRAIAVTQRGHGDSDRPAHGYATRDFSADVAALLDRLELPSAAIVGHSMGSIVARRFAADHPERTAALVLVGTFARFAGRPDMEEFAATVSELRDPIDPGFLREFQESTVAGPVPAPFLETIVAESCKVPARVFQAALAGIFEDDVCDDLRQITAPTLIAWGDHDAFCRRVGQDTLLAGLPDARLSVYEGVAHNPHWEQPRRFARELVTFAT